MQHESFSCKTPYFAKRGLRGVGLFLIIIIKRFVLLHFMRWLTLGKGNSDQPGERKGRGFAVLVDRTNVQSYQRNQIKMAPWKMIQAYWNLSLKRTATVSASKLLNSSFSQYDEDDGVLTRKKSNSVGLGVASANDQVASGFKLQDATLLNDCIASAAICSSCRKPQSKLELYQHELQREGLAKCLFLRCSICKHESPLKTSKRLGGVGGGAHEVNRRSVLASQKLGQAGLNDFCARMNLPPPVTKKSYNDHLVQIEKVAFEHAKHQMQDAAKRLFELVSTSGQSQHPGSIVDGNGVEVAEVAVTVDGTWDMAKKGPFFQDWCRLHYFCAHRGDP